MSYKLVVKTVNNEKVLVGFVPADAASINGAELTDVIVNSMACQEPSKELKAFIDSNAHKSFNLHKVVGNQVVCRSIEDLMNSNFITWQWNYQPAIAESVGHTPAPTQANG